MAYTEGRHLLTSSMLSLTDEDLAVTANDFATWEPGLRIEVLEFGFVLTEAVVATSTAPSVSLDHVAVDTTRTEKAVITIPNGAAVGDVYQSTRPKINTTTGLTPFIVEPGEYIVFEHKQITVGGSITGQGHYFIVWTEAPDDSGNATNWYEVAS